MADPSGRSLRFFLSQLFGPGLRDEVGLGDRARNVQLLGSIGVLFGLLFSLFNLFSREFVTLGFIELGSVFALILPAVALSRRHAALKLAENLLMLGGAVIFLALIVFGGVEGTGLLWVYVFPFFAFFIKGQKRGWLWSLGFIALVGLYNLTLRERLALGYPYTSVYITQFLASLVFYTLVAAAFNLLRLRFEERLHERVEEHTANANHYLTQLQYQAAHDALTGLPNQAHLLEILKAEIAQVNASGKAILICNVHLERLFEFGNVLGMNETDKLILRIADHLVKSVAGKGTLARTQRDEFVVIYRMQSPVFNAQALHEFILANQISVEQQGIAFNIEFTLGLCIYPVHSDEAPILLQKAEQAMLQARKRRLPWSIYDAEQERAFVRHHVLFSRLREAIQSQSLSVHYQPQIDLRTGQVVGAEALMRWRDAREGMIPPNEFIPVAEDTGLIRPMTRWLLRQCMQDCASWHAQGLALEVSINLSALSLNDPELLDTLTQAAKDTGIDPACVTLELTESSFMASPERALEIMLQIRAAGFSLSIDDFGTGYSSLAYLKNLPITELKIDQAFIRNLIDNPGDQAIVTSTLELAHNFGLIVVAEGIEDEKSANWLTERHCDRGQGYWYARPLPADQWLAFVQTHNKAHCVVAATSTKPA